MKDIFESMKKKYILSVLLGMSVVLLLALLISGRRLRVERNLAAGLFRAEHSLFEDIRICGQGGNTASAVGSTVGAGSDAGDTAVKSEQESEGTADVSVDADGKAADEGAEAAGGAESDAGDTAVKSEQESEGSADVSVDADGKAADEGAEAAGGTESDYPAGEAEEDDLSTASARCTGYWEELCLVSEGKGDRWAAYIPSDLSDRSYVCFSHFQRLDLEAEGENVRDLSLRNGDRITWSDYPNGTVLKATAVGWDNKIAEESTLVVYCADEIATLYLSTSSHSMDAINADKSVREEGRYVFYTGEGKRDASGRCRIHGRGNSSWKADKKQYSLNLASSRSVLGMDVSEKLALIANHSDDSNLRNKAVFDLAEACGMPSTPETVFVNVYFNGLYNGLYLLTQRPNARGGSVEIGDLETENYEAAVEAGEIENSSGEEADSAEGDNKDSGTSSGNNSKTGGTSSGNNSKTGGRSSENNTETGIESAGHGEEDDAGADEDFEDFFDVIDFVDESGLEIHASSQESVPENISGGYLLEMDGRYEDEKYWFSTNRHHFVVKYPESVPLKEEEYIADYVRKAEKAFYQEDGVNPETGKSWEEYLDKDSWVKMYMFQDFMAQWDVESFSFFVYKEQDNPLLYCGPVWDFDLSMGATAIGKLPNVLRQSMWLRDHREGWLTQLESHEAFSDALREFAEKEFYPALETWLADSDKLISSLRTSAAMDRARWDEDDKFEESAQAVTEWLAGRRAFLRDYTENPGDYCTVTLRYGFSDMEIYVRRGEKIGFVPIEEYGEKLFSSFRKKYGEIDGWIGEDGEVLSADTVIDRDQVFTPFEK